MCPHRGRSSRCESACWRRPFWKGRTPGMGSESRALPICSRSTSATTPTRASAWIQPARSGGWDECGTQTRSSHAPAPESRTRPSPRPVRLAVQPRRNRRRTAKVVAGARRNGGVALVPHARQRLARPISSTQRTCRAAMFSMHSSQRTVLAICAASACAQKLHRMMRSPALLNSTIRGAWNGTSAKCPREAVRRLAHPRRMGCHVDPQTRALRALERGHAFRASNAASGPPRITLSRPLRMARARPVATRSCSSLAREGR